MSKILAVMIAGLFAAGAYAQGSGTPQDVPTNTKPQVAAEKKVEARPAGKVAKPTGDVAQTAEGGGVGVGNAKANAAGEKRAETRNDRRRNKDGSVRRAAKLGGTPQ